MTKNLIYIYMCVYMYMDMCKYIRICMYIYGIPRTEKPGGLQFMGSQRVGHDSVTDAHMYTYVVVVQLLLCPTL